MFPKNLSRRLFKIDGECMIFTIKDNVFHIVIFYKNNSNVFINNFII